MGEIAEMMLDGTMDPETGEFNFDGEDGPGFPMTGEEATEFKRATGWKSPLGSSEPRKLHGVWLKIARTVSEGAKSIGEVADRLHDPEKEARVHTGKVVASNVTKMLSVRLLHRADGELHLTRKGAAQLAAAE